MVYRHVSRHSLACVNKSGSFKKAATAWKPPPFIFSFRPSLSHAALPFQQKTNCIVMVWSHPVSFPFLLYWLLFGRLPYWLILQQFYPDYRYIMVKNIVVSPAPNHKWDPRTQLFWIFVINYKWKLMILLNFELSGHKTSNVQILSQTLLKVGLYALTFKC